MTTNYDKVATFNKCFGNAVNTERTELDQFNLGQRLALIVEELKEYLEAPNRLEKVDALADTLYVTYGLATVMGATWLRDISMEGISNFEFKLLGKEGNLEKDVKEFRDCLDAIFTSTITQLSTIDGHTYASLSICCHTLLVCCYQAGRYIYNVDMDYIFDLVHQANMSKICTTVDQARETVQDYLDHPERGYLTPSFREVDIDGVTYFVVYNVETNKILKNKYWKEADLSFLNVVNQVFYP